MTDKNIVKTLSLLNVKLFSLLWSTFSMQHSKCLICLTKEPLVVTPLLSVQSSGQKFTVFCDFAFLRREKCQIPRVSRTEKSPQNTTTEFDLFLLSFMPGILTVPQALLQPGFLDNTSIKVQTVSQPSNKKYRKTRDNVSLSVTPHLS